MIDSANNQATLGYQVSTTSYSLNSPVDSILRASLTTSLSEVMVKQDIASKRYGVNNKRLLEYIEDRHFPTDEKLADILTAAGVRLKEESVDLDAHIADLVGDNFESLIWK